MTKKLEVKTLALRPSPIKERACTEVTNLVQHEVSDGWTLRSSFVHRETVFLVFVRKP